MWGVGEIETEKVTDRKPERDRQTKIRHLGPSGKAEEAKGQRVGCIIASRRRRLQRLTQSRIAASLTKHLHGLLMALESLKMPFRGKSLALVHVEKAAG